MTIEELNKKIEEIEVLGGTAMLITRVYQKDVVQGECVSGQIILTKKHKGDIDVIILGNNGDEKVLSIGKTEKNIPYVMIPGKLYDDEGVSVLVDILQVCKEYLKSFKVENPNTD